MEPTRGYESYLVVGSSVIKYRMEDQVSSKVENVKLAVTSVIAGILVIVPLVYSLFIR